MNNDDLNKNTGMQCPTYRDTGKPCAGCEKCETFDLVRDQRDILDALYKDSQAQVRTLTVEVRALASRVSGLTSRADITPWRQRFDVTGMTDEERREAAVKAMAAELAEWHALGQQAGAAQPVALLTDSAKWTDALGEYASSPSFDAAVKLTSFADEFVRAAARAAPQPVAVPAGWIAAVQRTREDARVVFKDSLGITPNDVIEYMAGAMLAAAPTPPQQPAEPSAPHILEALSWHAGERDDLTLEQAVEAFRHGYKKVSQRSDRAMLAQIIDLLASQPEAPTPPTAQGKDAIVQDTLTGAEIEDIIKAINSAMNPAAGMFFPRGWNVLLNKLCAMKSPTAQAGDARDEKPHKYEWQAKPGQKWWPLYLKTDEEANEYVEDNDGAWRLAAQPADGEVAK